jgi:hypothetical protein
MRTVNCDRAWLSGNVALASKRAVPHARKQKSGAIRAHTNASRLTGRERRVEKRTISILNEHDLEYQSAVQILT